MFVLLIFSIRNVRIREVKTLTSIYGYYVVKYEFKCGLLNPNVIFISLYHINLSNSVLKVNCKET